MITVNANPQGAQGSGIRAVHYQPLMKLLDNKSIGLSVGSDGSTAARGTLYPSNLNNHANLGTPQTYMTAELATLDAGAGFDVNDYASGASKIKVGERYFNKYKRFKYIKYQASTQNNAILTSFFSSISSNAHKIAELDSTRFVLFYNDNNANLKAIVGTIASGAITFGSSVVINAAQCNADGVNAVLIGTDKVAVVYNLTAGGAALSAKVITIATSTITVGSVNNFAASGYNGSGSIAIGKLATDAFIIGWAGGSGGTPTFQAFTVSGTTITAGSAVTDSGTVGAMVCGTAAAGNKGMFWWSDRAGASKAIAFTTSGSTITKGTAVTTSGDYPGTWMQSSMWEAGTDVYIAIGSSRLYPFTLSGTTITAGTNIVLTGWSGYHHKVVTLAAGDYLVYTSSGVVRIAVTAGGASVTTAYASRINSTSGGSYSIPACCGTTVFDVADRNGTNTSLYYSLGGAGTIEFYNDATIIGSAVTPTVQLGTNQQNIDNAINGNKAYLKIKNTAAFTQTIVTSEVGVEVD
ncbi:MAG: hypothetical protein M3P98_01595 [bacterium]|nr:hypothetical protein [bacterium]